MNVTLKSAVVPIAELSSVTSARTEQNFSTLSALRSISFALISSNVTLVSSFISLTGIRNFEEPMFSAPFFAPLGKEYCLVSTGNRVSSGVFLDRSAGH